MAPNAWKDKSSRLSAFVTRNNSDSGAHYNASAMKTEEPTKRSGTPQAAGLIAAPPPPTAPTREDMAEIARIPIPKVKRTLPITHHPNVVSLAHELPKHAHHAEPRPKPPGTIRQTVEIHEPASPPKPLDQVNLDQLQRRDIFEGSELGESFMRSGRTSPLSEVDETQYVAGGGKEFLMSMAAPDIKDQDLDPVPRLRTRKPDVGAFRLQVGGDGRMVVEEGGRRSPSRIDDGFTHGPWRKTQQHQREIQQRPSILDDRAIRLPVREIEVRKPQPQKTEHRSAWPNPSRTLDQAIWASAPLAAKDNTSMVVDVDEDRESVNDQERDAEVTPKAKRVQARPLKAAKEIKMPVLPTSLHQNKSRKRPRSNPDYDDMALSGMSFAELQREPFDLDPAKLTMLNGQGDDANTLPLRLDQLRHQDEHEHKAFFARMSMEDWEASGDWFVEQFADIMNKLKDARKEKRRMVSQFEDEAAAREEDVRLRTESIERKLDRMRHDGQRVVHDRAA